MVPRILIVEDDSLTRFSLATTLTGWGCVVVKAPSAAAAVHATKACEPDLILLDVNLSERDGVNVLEALRESDPNLPILLMSSFITTRIKHCALRLGVLDRIDGAILARIVGREIGGSGRQRVVDGVEDRGELQSDDLPRRAGAGGQGSLRP